MVAPKFINATRPYNSGGIITMATDSSAFSFFFFFDSKKKDIPPTSDRITDFMKVLINGW